ncbi:N-acetylneuraminate synthase/N,N'-diacetyllegionaminate synthase [Candidatus Methanophagaceae archaeon]|nr:N-acetylneuraminate synthase/N,N'-diacetyllegionaminate synthase [Methanophagales archaeon]
MWRYKGRLEKVDIPEGAIITEDLLDVKRSGTGIKPKYMGMIIGTKARRDIRKEDLITEEIIE